MHVKDKYTVIHVRFTLLFIHQDCLTLQGLTKNLHTKIRVFLFLDDDYLKYQMAIPKAVLHFLIFFFLYSKAFSHQWLEVVVIIKNDYILELNHDIYCMCFFIIIRTYYLIMIYTNKTLFSLYMKKRVLNRNWSDFFSAAFHFCTFERLVYRLNTLLLEFIYFIFPVHRL